MSIEALDRSFTEKLVSLESECFTYDRWSQKQIEEEFLNSTSVIYGVIEGTVLLGALLARIDTFQEGCILKVMVQKQARGKGIGERLIKHLQHSADIESISIYLEVATDNIAAVNLYEKCNFKKKGLRRNYYPSHAQENSKNAYTMRWERAG